MRSGPQPIWNRPPQLLTSTTRKIQQIANRFAVSGAAAKQSQANHKVTKQAKDQWIRQFVDECFEAARPDLERGESGYRHTAMVTTLCDLIHSLATDVLRSRKYLKRGLRVVELELVQRETDADADITRFVDSKNLTEQKLRYRERLCLDPIMSDTKLSTPQWADESGVAETSLREFRAGRANLSRRDKDGALEVLRRRVADLPLEVIKLFE